nr:trypsin-like peptidase domain-containing protein [Kibdelosporangium sp. MJ126-NF4]CEL17586.1 serine protease [Kibdelosporangium sp. MJ126-NF4]CTQ91188.1 serine protease [Kibdelosporangium sp. MJ126-NF4]
MAEHSRIGVALATFALLLTGCTIETPRQPRAEDAPPVADHGGYAALVERLGPSVVTIQTSGGLGSGIVLRPDVLVTNAHVVGQSRDVTVAYADGTRSPGTVHATDTVTDLAVVRTERKNLPVPDFRPELPRPGEPAIAIGSPLGFRNSVTAGIISGLHRRIPGTTAQAQSLVDLIQTDAPISPGNSGGALLDASGKVVGVNEAYLPPATGAVSLGFAIPAATVLDVTGQLLDDGTAEHPYLGMSVGPLTDSIRQRLGVRAQNGVLVLDVDSGGPAASAGIAPGDVIVELARSEVRDVSGLLTHVRQTEPGQRLPLTFVRDGDRAQADVTVGTRTN